ncbi:MAG: hypothetical protein NTX25_16315, partial [Proteobacteria bacterium]|nr:hypothetical protein [Pseudomonadota bacterium]
MLHRLRTFILTLLLFTACVSDPQTSPLPPPGPLRCEFLTKQINWKEEIKTLDSISTLFHNGCYEETIKIGSKARETYRFKKYSILQESAEIFLAEGTVTDYVMESYERGYLSFLILLSYVHRGEPQAVTVELNRFYSEEVASLYNYGQDPINALLQATLWENYPIEGFSSRPFWLWMSNAAAADQELRNFALARVKDFDAKVRHAPWHISEVGTFPDLEWSMTFADAKSGYFNIKPKTAFEPACSEPDAILVPTKSWFHKIAMRHSKAYHPLVNAKSWIRLPIGILYGISTAT